MNASRLKAILESLLSNEEALDVQGRLSKLSGALGQMVQEPQSEQRQSEVAAAMGELDEVLQSLANRYQPSQFEDLAELGATEFFDTNIVNRIRDLSATNAMTPAVVHSDVRSFTKKRDQYLQRLKRINEDLEALGVDAEPLDEGEAEIGFRIPGSLFHEELEGLIKELNTLKIIIRAFSEIAVGKAEPIVVREISSTDPLFFFSIDPLTIAMLGGVVTWALNTWKQVEEIRKLRAETRQLPAFSDEEIDAFFSKKIEATVEKEIEAKANELLPNAKEGRAAEQLTHVEWALEQILARIERGMTVEIRFLPPPPASEEATPKDKKLTEAFKSISETVPRLSFPAPEPHPVLKLTTADNNDKGPSSAGEAKKTPPGRKGK